MVKQPLKFKIKSKITSGKVFSINRNGLVRACMAYHVQFYHTHPQEPAQQIYSESLLVEWNKSEGWKRKWLMSLNTLARQDLEKKKSGLGWKTTLVLENKYKMATNTFRLEISRKCLTTRKVWKSHLTPGRKPIHCCFTKAPAIKMQHTFWNVVFTLCGCLW